MIKRDRTYNALVKLPNGQTTFIKVKGKNPNDAYARMTVEMKMACISINEVV